MEQPLEGQEELAEISEYKRGTVARARALGERARYVRGVAHVVTAHATVRINAEITLDARRLLRCLP